MNVLLKKAVSELTSSLRKKSVTTCSQWAEAYRVMGRPFPGKFSFRHHPWAREMHDCDSEFMVGQKGAQLAFTETALNKVFFNIDIKRQNVLYLLPAATPDATDFSTSRFDPALELSDHLRDLFSDTNNIGHKRAGSASLFVRGSRSRSAVKSLPISFLVADEVDEMNKENLRLAFERVAGQIDYQIFLLSTPTIDGNGINKYFRDSSQDHYMFPCPHCDRKIELTFPESIVITDDPNDSYLICSYCKDKLPHEEKSSFLSSGVWVPSYSNRDMRGFTINQLYSPTVKPKDIAKAYLDALRDPTDEQEFYNSKLGLTHVVEDARITDADLDSCIKEHHIIDQYRGFNLVTMGVDVGKKIHYEIAEWFVKFNEPEFCRVLRMGTVEEFEHLHSFYQDFKLSAVVVDLNPERRKALELAKLFPNTRLCHYLVGISGRVISEQKDNIIAVDRTSWLDASLGRFRNQTIALPLNTSLEYRQHLQNIVRVPKKDRDGNPVVQYVTGENQDDHYAHARNYNEIAFTFARGLGVVQDVKIW